MQTVESTPPLVLVVNDDAPGRYLLGRYLRQGDLRVVEASSGAEALAIAARTLPDLVVLDVKLPDLCGYEVARRLRASPAAANLGVVYVSAFYTAETIRGVPGGGDAYLTFPLDGAELLTTIRLVLQARRKPRASLLGAQL